MEEWKVAASVVGGLDSASVVVEEAESDAIARLEGWKVPDIFEAFIS